MVSPALKIDQLLIGPSVSRNLENRRRLRAVTVYWHSSWP